MNEQDVKLGCLGRLQQPRVLRGGGGTKCKGAVVKEAES